MKKRKAKSGRFLVPRSWFFVPGFRFSAFQRFRTAPFHFPRSTFHFFF